MRISTLIRITAMMCLLGSLARAGGPPAEALVFHSPTDDGISSGIAAIPMDGSMVPLNVWILYGSDESLPADKCAGTGTGEEICNWDVRLATTGDVTFTDFVTSADVVFKLSFGTLFRANGGNPVDPPAAAERIGVLHVSATGPGTVTVDGDIFVTSLQTRGNITAAVLATTGNDTDVDGIADVGDNCTLVANPAQRDTNGDGIGNICDPDVAVPNDCAVNFPDLNVYKTNFFAAGDLDTDNNGDGQTNFIDLNIVKSFFFGPPGPSANGCN